MTTFLRDEGPIAYYCALEYCPEKFPRPPRVERVVLLVVRYENGLLNIFVSSDWETIIDPKHREYFRALLDDFEARAETARDALLKQIASLSVGPLVTYAAGTGSELAANEPLLDVCKHFVVLR
jgi:hypothetical protein